LIVSGIKQSYPGQLPLAVFVHLPTLCAAPYQMILAGLGDMLGKLTALADWELGSLVWDEPYDVEIAARSRLDLQRCIDVAGDIAARQPTAMRVLVESLLDSGLNMARAGNSRPASGAEHHLAHYWEMKLLWEAQPPILHGIKVGFATLWICDTYTRLRAIDRSAVASWLQKTNFPNVQAQSQEIRQIFVHSPEKIIAEQKRFLKITPAEWLRLKERVYDQWQAIQAIASTVPARVEVEKFLAATHFPMTARDVGLIENDVQSGLVAAPYLRDRFTVLKLVDYLTRL
jgi:glycerol-1-phosphate dehydrogenase [NAD(P)+]